MGISSSKMVINDWKFINVEIYLSSFTIILILTYDNKTGIWLTKSISESLAIYSWLKAAVLSLTLEFELHYQGNVDVRKELEVTHSLRQC